MFPKTRARLDDLLARLLERETLFGIAALAMLFLEGWKAGSAAAGFAGLFALARGYVKRHGG